MSVRLGLLALLNEQPMYGYQLRTEFEARTGGSWPLNIGQVYTTLARLDRDGLVTAEGDDGEGHQIYALTDDGHAEIQHWFQTPVARTERPRDELAIKLSMALRVDGVDVRDVVQTQRTATLQDLQEMTRQKAHADDEDIAGRLVLDSLIFQAEAVIRWLDHCEQLLLATPRRARSRGRQEGVRR